MGQPICPARGVAFAFPDVCTTPTPAGSVPVPYPNVAQLTAAKDVAEDLLVGPDGLRVLLRGSVVQTSSGDEAGTAGGTKSGSVMGACEVTGGSGSVLYGGREVARFGDPTSQNDGNAVGRLLGAFPTVLVGN